MSQSNQNRSPQTLFTEKLEPIRETVFRRVCRQVNDPQLAEEVSEDALTHAFEKLLEDEKFFDERNPLQWVSQLARWRAIDVIRYRQRFTLLFELVERDDEEHRAPPHNVPDQQVEKEREELLRLVWETLQLLDEEDRLILEAYYYEQKSDQEIGTDLYGEHGSVQARGLRVWRRRQKAHARLGVLLMERGLDPTEYSPSSSQAL